MSKTNPIQSAYNPTVKNNSPVWVDGATGNTPICSVNLNNMHEALKSHDGNIVAFDQRFSGAITNITWDATHGILTFYAENESKPMLSIDLNIEAIPVAFAMDADGIITMTTADGTEYKADIGSLIKTYTFNDSANIDFSTTTDASGNHTITATVIPGSLTLSDFDSDLNQRFLDAENNAKLSKSFAVGNTGMRVDEDIDNAKYYKEQIELLKKYTEDAVNISSFSLDANGNLVYEDNAVYLFTVDNNGMLNYEVK